MASQADLYEKLGAFYLGREYDVGAEAISDRPLLYDSKDLTTHAVCVGMTGSGKTGLGISLLEEAAIDGIPVIALDPKGDLGNLLLTFPDLRPDDFRPWLDAGAAARAGRSLDDEASATAERWRSGLAEWGQEPARIARFAGSVDRAIYTPGSGAGRPLSLLRSFAAPPRAVVDDREILGERVQAAVSGLLGLLGIDADPIRSREHVLLSTLIARAWNEGRDLDLGALIRQVQRPPMERVGVLDLETFFPERDRMALVMAINNLVASPSFASWLEGEPLEASHLLYGEGGRPRMSIIALSHLSDAERMFVVTSVLNAVVAWIRTQPGSQTLRAILYMDEVFGYLPPSAAPPSKLPMLTLLKQARAFGLGVVLATQNPVDLDYKALSNAGTWFLGRLQTERDKARVIEGLEGASAAAGTRFDKAKMEATLAGLKSRVFVMNNVHDDAPVVFHTRWALSYLGGPLTRDQIRTLGDAAGAPATANPVAPAAGTSTPAGDTVPARSASASRPDAPPTSPRKDAPAPIASDDAGAERPVIPTGVTEGFFPIVKPRTDEEQTHYRPHLLGVVTLHYANARLGLDEWQRVAVLAPVPDTSGTPWDEAVILGSAVPELESAPEPRTHFAELSAPACRAKSYVRWRKQLTSHLYRNRRLQLWRSKKPKAASTPGEDENAFRGRLRDLLRADRDAAKEKLRKRYTPKLARLQDQIARALERVEREEEQYEEKRAQTVISVGATIVGALFGRKIASRANVGRATTAVRGASRTARERGDIGRAEARVEELREKLVDLERAFEEDLADLDSTMDVASLECEEVEVTPRKSDLEIETFALVWAPYREPGGGAEPLYT